MPSQPSDVPVGNATPGKYPAWGVDTNTYQIVEAKNASQQNTDVDQGYIIWFASDSAAKSFVSSQTSILNGQVPDPLSGVAGSLEAFYRAVTDYTMWRSLGWLALGALLFLWGVLLWLRIPQGVIRAGTNVAGSAARAAIALCLPRHAPTPRPRPPAIPPPARSAG